MKVLVVDDEPLARRRLVGLLRRLAIVTAIEEAEDGAAALARAAAFDVLLLDISMPAVDGLEVAAALRERPAVIFTTAHPQHALTAYEHEAVDYLLKPVQQARLERALSRVAVRAPATPKITARHRDGVYVFDPAAIESFRAADKLTAFTADGREHLVDQSLGSLEAALAGFVRVHRNQVVRVDAVVRLGRDEEGAFVVLASGDVARVSRRQLAEVEARLGVRSP